MTVSRHLRLNIIGGDGARGAQALGWVTGGVEGTPPGMAQVKDLVDVHIIATTPENPPGTLLPYLFSYMYVLAPTALYPSTCFGIHLELSVRCVGYWPDPAVPGVFPDWLNGEPVAPVFLRLWLIRLPEGRVLTENDFSWNAAVRPFAPEEDVLWHYQMAFHNPLGCAAVPQKRYMSLHEPETIHADVNARRRLHSGDQLVLVVDGRNEWIQYGLKPAAAAVEMMAAVQVVGVAQVFRSM